ncbi:MAG: hypothetical protein RMJ33_05060 [Saprospiraceae bacterium]|nr:hypothetical protein [Saprospiraceae bacterium]MDW8229190.1 hypothetical protein [Saprospiraceae bacterium]
MNESPTYNRIERYLLGQMSPEERAIFEAELERDPVLAEQFALQQREHEALEVIVEDRLRAQLKAWAEQFPLRAPAPWYRRPATWMAAASLLLLSGILYFAWLRPHTTYDAVAQGDSPLETYEPTPLPKDSSTEETAIQQPPASTDAPDVALRYIALAERYTERPKFQRIIVRSEQEQLSYMDSAYLILEKGQYARAIQRLRRIPKSDDHYTTARHLIGEAFFAKAEYARAIPYLQEAADTPDYLRKSEAEWQLALAFLHLKKIKNSRRVLRQIANDTTHPRYAKAVQLLSELERQ